MHAVSDNAHCHDGTDDKPHVVDNSTVLHSMPSNRDMSGNVLNREEMELSYEKGKNDGLCVSQKYLRCVTPYILFFLSIMICVLAGAICHFHLETDKLETEMEALRQSMTMVSSTRGEKGERGEAGVPGYSGASGQKGRPGMGGFPGLKGVPGLKGARGHNGDHGDIGPAGSQGFKGNHGEKGNNGRRGEIGEAGFQGTQGVNGLKGEKGDMGPIGPMSETVFNETEIQVRGPPGPRGERGPQGEKGEMGESVMPADPFGKIFHILLVFE